MRHSQERLNRSQQLLAHSLVLLALLSFAHVAVAQVRNLAPGVLHKIPAEPEEANTVTGPRSFDSLVNQLPKWKPNYLAESDTLAAIASETSIRRTIWQLEFEFKPVRMLKTPDGRLIWYLVYKVRNVGGHIGPQQSDVQPGEGQAEKGQPAGDGISDSVVTLERVDFPVRFYPVFQLQGHDYKRLYVDRVLPDVLEMVHAKEIRDPRTRLYDSVDIGSRRLELSTDAIDRGVWGVAMWEGIDPRTDFFSVFVGGLTNAYQWPDGANVGEGLKYRTLQLNFWRPGDTYRESEDEIRFGMPQFGEIAKQEKLLKLYELDKPRDHIWIYR